MSNFICSEQQVIKTPLQILVRLYMFAVRISRYEALNCCASYSQSDTDILDVRLKKCINELKNNGLDTETGRVNYNKLRDNATFHEYEELVCELQEFDLNTLQTDSQKKAFWINIYNVLIIHGVIAYGIKKSVMEISGVFERFAYIIGRYRFSADDIEHGILRANRGHPAMFGERFGADDPRRQFCLKTLDPRIHFALVCASESCPPIDVYYEEQIDKQLILATQNFVNSNEVIIDLKENTIYLSKIFQWYSPDFGGRLLALGSKIAILEFIIGFLIDNDDRYFVGKYANTLQVKFKKYDWSLNV